MRLIDADELEREIKSVISVILHEFGETPLTMEACEAMSAVVARMHSMGAVEIVRCKECKWRNTKGCPYANFNAEIRADFDFCSDGDRRDDNGT